MPQEPILLVGAGGHARACIDVIEQEGRFFIIGLVGKETEVGSILLGYSVLGTDDDLPSLLCKSPNALITIGQIKTQEHRVRLFNLLSQTGFELPAVVSPYAYVSPYATLAAGTIVMHGVVVNSGSIVGKNCIINSQALIEHDSVISDHCHISTSAIINGEVHVGAGTFIGSGSIIKHGITIGEQCVIGMGQSVRYNCEANTALPRKKGLK
jgi:sugar O-acyltransferase (sialic acid O-acetyltransferase NeuD family)